MKTIRAMSRFFFNKYWGLSIRKKLIDWDFMTDKTGKYIGYCVFGVKEKGGVTISVPMLFDKPYTNKDYALVAMMIHWRLYCKGYKLTKDNKIAQKKRK